MKHDKHRGNPLIAFLIGCWSNGRSFADAKTYGFPDIISDKICSKTNKNNQGQVTNLSEQVIAMVLVTNLHQNSKWMHTKIQK